MAKAGYVYILASKGRRLYIGVTSELRIRVKQHKQRVNPNCFTARYNID
jgi:putative endonuclease